MGRVTMPEENSTGPDHDGAPLGAAVAPAGDPESDGGSPDSAGDIAGPSYPPAETEPAAHRSSD